MYLRQEAQNLLMENAELIRKQFKEQNQIFQYYLAVNMLKRKGEIDLVKIRDLMNYIKEETKLFSVFRGHTFILSVLLAGAYKKPEAAFKRMLDHYDLLVESGFKHKHYLPLMSYAMDSVLYGDQIQDMMIQTRSYRSDLIEKTKKVYKKMKYQHRWITGGDDYTLAMLIAHNDGGLNRMESFYVALQEKGFKKGNDLQAMANILALSDLPLEKLILRVEQILRVSKTKGFKIRRMMYSGIGLLALVTEQKEHLIHVFQAVEDMKSMKKFKRLDPSLLFLFAVDLISEDIKKELGTKTITETTLAITMEQIIAAQTAVIISATTASTAGAGS